MVSATASVSAQAPDGVFSPPIIISAGGFLAGRESQPASSPSVLALADRSAYVVWWVRSEFAPDDDWMWETSVTSGTVVTPTLLSGAPGAQQPRLVRGPGGSLHATFRSWSPQDNAYNTNYIQHLPGDPLPWPPPAYGPPPLFATGAESLDPNLTVAQNQQTGDVRAHVVWSQDAPSLSRPLIYYSRVGAGWQKGDTDGFSHIRGPGCSAGGVGVNCYAGYAPSIAIIDRAGGQEAIVVWEGRDYLSNTPAVYFGRSPLLADGAPSVDWSAPAQLSGAGVAKGSAACPNLEGYAPSIAVSPTGQLHAAWIEQELDCQYYIHTGRLRFDTASQTFVPDYLERVSPRPVSIDNQTSVDRPRLAFDGQGRRYVVWKESYSAIRAAVGDATQDHWQDLGQLNSGVCGDSQSMEAVDLAASPSRATLHVVWVARVALNAGRVCYSTLDTLTYRGHLPLVANNTLRP